MFTDKAVQPQPDTWLLEDIQIRKVVRLNPPTEEPAHVKATVKTRPSSDLKTDTDMLEKEHTAFRMALDLSRLEEERRQAVREQERVEKAFREGKRNKGKDSKRRDGEAGKVERTILEVEKEKIARELLEREKDAALRRVVGEEFYNMLKERVLREAAEKDRELKREEEARVEKERVRKEAEAEAQRELEREVLKRAKELEMKKAAVARVAEDSIITEAARRLIDKERERKRVEEMAERVRREVDEEEKTREERLRRRVEGRKAYTGTNTDGFGQPDGMFGGGHAAWDGDVREIVTPYPPTGVSYPTAYTIHHKGRQDAITTPIWHGYVPGFAPRFLRPDGTTGDLRLMGYDLDVDRLDETHARGWRKPSKDSRRWRETTTERWETVIYRQDKGHDEYRRFKETTKLTKCFG